MMKNKKMGILAVLVMLVAVTLNAVGGTYAKYISSVDFTDEARVAKWDFKINGSDPAAFANFDVDLFKDSYETKEIAHKFVVSNTPGVDVVAPGTKGEYKLALTGTAETNYTVEMKNVDVTNTIKTNGSNGKVYDPIVFKLEVVKGGVAQEAKTGLTSAKLEEELKKLYATTKEVEGENGTKVTEDIVYPANHSLNDSITISWEWKLDNGEDILDTLLAQDSTKKVKVAFNITVTQTDKAATVTPSNEALNGSVRATFNKADLSALKAMGYEPALVKGVKATFGVDTLTLTGKVLHTEDGADAGFSNVEGDKTGYYYPITIKVNKDARITWSSNPTKTDDITAGEDFTILYALRDNATKKVTATVEILGKDADNNEIVVETQTYTVDYAGVEFIPAE